MTLLKHYQTIELLNNLRKEKLNCIKFHVEGDREYISLKRELKNNSLALEFDPILCSFTCYKKSEIVFKIVNSDIEQSDINIEGLVDYGRSLVRIAKRLLNEDIDLKDFIVLADPLAFDFLNKNRICKSDYNK